MSECYGKFYIRNGNFYSGESFSDEHIKSGKSVYEVIRIIDGIPLFLDKHLDRFKNSAGLINKKLLLDKDEIQKSIHSLVEKEQVSVGNVKIVFNYSDEENYYFYFIKHSYPDKEQYKDGVHTVLYHGERENPNAKVINSDFREKVNCVINENHAYEAILVDRDGFITEGSKSNIFMVYQDTVITSPLEAVLPGVTRDVIISLTKDAGIPFKEEKFHYSNVSNLDGLFVSGTSPQVLPIKTVDSNEFDSAKNDTIQRLMDLYEEKVRSYLENYKYKK